MLSVSINVAQTGWRARRKVRMESSGGVLQDLAKREQVLSGKVQAARDQVASLIADAEGKAKAVLAKADADAKALESEYRVKREAEEKSILETSLSGARAAAQAASSAAQAKVADAVKLVISKVIP
jgi:vacuolar-type H+-ATPase subunit H